MKSFGLFFLLLSIFVISSEAANKWYPQVSGYNKNDSNNGYAGVFGVPVTALRVNGGYKYAVHLLNGDWLPSVTGNSVSNHNNGYAGTINGDAIDAIAVSGNVEYAVHIKGGNWLPPVKKYDLNDDDYGYAGIMGRAIDAVMIKGRTYATARYVKGSNSGSGGSGSGSGSGGSSTNLTGNNKTIINNLKKNLKFDQYKNEAMIEAATQLLANNYDPKFVAGVLGNIQNEGTPGLFEYSGYAGENEHLRYMDDHFDYYNKYSGKTITQVGIKSAVSIANKALNSGIGGFGLGMVQWSFGRTNNLLAEYQRKSKTDKPSKNECAKIEASFIVRELKESYTKVYTNWKNSSYKTPYNAGYIFCTDYEKPGNTYYQADVRGNNAEAIYKLMK